MDKIFKFSFVCVNSIYNNTISVYSPYREYIDIFLNQHTFDVDNAVVECIDYSKQIDSNQMLSPFKFKSNILPEIYTIISTNEIIETCILDISHELNNKLYFGQSFRYYVDKIELFNVISDLVNQISFAKLVESLDSYDIGYYNFNEAYYDSLDSYINNPNEAELFRKVSANYKTDILNITLEGYVTAFTSIIISRYV